MTTPTRGEPIRHAVPWNWFSPGDAAALDGVVGAPVAEDIALDKRKALQATSG
jgi:hypothetical protein